MERSYREILTQIGEDPEREGLKRTPARAAESIRFLTRGYQEDVDALLEGAVFEEAHDDLVLVRNIEFYSMCEHHMLPFFGQAHVAYLPKGRIIGLSKIARVVDVFSQRLQVQERMTRQISDALERAIQPRGVAVVVEARHLCMMVRGVQKQNAVMVTSRLSGEFRDDPRSRAELFSLLGVARTGSEP
ncbi:MAG TPA: GTP cyclohydrolase I FolE [Armatimonadota bacterium]|jgi:GTP cyclohydrolase I